MSPYALRRENRTTWGRLNTYQVEAIRPAVSAMESTGERLYQENLVPLPLPFPGAPRREAQVTKNGASTTGGNVIFISRPSPPTTPTRQLASPSRNDSDFSRPYTKATV